MNENKNNFNSWTVFNKQFWTKYVKFYITQSAEGALTKRRGITNDMTGAHYNDKTGEEAWPNGVSADAMPESIWLLQHWPIHKPSDRVGGVCLS